MIKIKEFKFCEISGTRKFASFKFANFGGLKND